MACQRQVGGGADRLMSVCAFGDDCVKFTVQRQISGLKIGEDEGQQVQNLEHISCGQAGGGDWNAIRHPYPVEQSSVPLVLGTESLPRHVRLAATSAPQRLSPSSRC